MLLDEYLLNWDQMLHKEKLDCPATGAPKQKVRVYRTISWHCYLNTHLWDLKQKTKSNSGSCSQMMPS